MDASTLEITVISADDLQNVRKLGRRMRTYAVVRTSDDVYSTKSTHIDTDGGTNPVWNDKLQLSLNKGLARSRGYAIKIQIYCKTTFGEKGVGWAKVPFSDIVDGSGGLDGLHCLCYRLKTIKGMPHGTIDLSVRLLQNFNPPKTLNSPISMFPQKLGSYENINSAVASGTYGIQRDEVQQNTAMGVPSTWMQGYSYGNGNYVSPLPPSVYPPPRHQQIIY